MAEVIALLYQEICYRDHYKSAPLYFNSYVRDTVLSNFCVTLRTLSHTVYKFVFKFWLNIFAFYFFQLEYMYASHAIINYQCINTNKILFSKLSKWFKKVWYA